MGRNRRWVLEDSIQDAVWTTISSVTWEKQRSVSAVAHTANAQDQPRTRQSPPEMHAAVQAKVQRLQAALSVLGDADAVEQNLKRALSHGRKVCRSWPTLAKPTLTIFLTEFGQSWS